MESINLGNGMKLGMGGIEDFLESITKEIFGRNVKESVRYTVDFSSRYHGFEESTSVVDKYFYELHDCSKCGKSEDCEIKDIRPKAIIELRRVVNISDITVLYERVVYDKDSFSRISQSDKISEREFLEMKSDLGEESDKPILKSEISWIDNYGTTVIYSKYLNDELKGLEVGESFFKNHNLADFYDKKDVIEDNDYDLYLKINM